MKKVSIRPPLALAVVLAFGGTASAQQTSRVSIASEGTQANGGSFKPAISADGRYEAFASSATNLVPSDMNGFIDVFVRDRLTGKTERVSVDSTAAESDGDSSNASISADGRFVAFDSTASSLVPGDTNGSNDVFVRDRQTGTTERVSVATGGAQGNSTSSSPSISADGRYVAFLSNATTLVAGDVNGSAADVYLRDRQTGTTERLSVDSGGLQGNAGCSFVSISPDGRWVVFSSQATNLVPADTNATDDVFLRDRQLHSTERVSLGAGGAQGDGPSLGGTISSDGRFVAFWSDADNLVAGDTNGSTDVFLRDRTSATTERVSVDSIGSQGNQASDRSSISADGRCVAFASYSTNLVAGDSNGTSDDFVRDRQANSTRRVSLDSAGAQGNGFSGSPAMSSDGRYIVFWSQASNLVAGDTNAVDDVFLRDLQSGTNLITQRVSVDSSGAQGNGASSGGSVSPDGRYVAFSSYATDLVLHDTNGASDVFVRDRQTGVTERVSVDSGGAEGNSTSWVQAISSDGRYVAFQSLATNLVPGDTNGFWDVFVRDRQNATTERVSVDSNGNQGNADVSLGGILISPDGRYVVFLSTASNLDVGDTNGAQDVFLRDRLMGTTERVNLGTGATQVNGGSGSPALSATGRFVAFAAGDGNVVPGDTNGVADVFLRDRQLGTTERVSVGAGAVQGNDMSLFPSITNDGRFVAFESYATNLVPGDTNALVDVFVRDRQAATTERVSVSSTGIQGNDESYSGVVSDDGRFVAFMSRASNLVSGDTNGSYDAFLRDRQSGSTERESLSSSGAQGNGDTYLNSMSSDGRYVVFSSLATNLAQGDTNGVYDVFARDRLGASVLTSLCDPGLNGVHACPCANAPSGPGRGCDNSASTGGAVLSASGGAYLSSDSLIFTTSGEKPTGLSVLWQGPSSVTTGIVFGQGVRCVGGTLKRLYSKSAVGGSITAPNYGAGDPTVSARSATLGSLILSGQSRYYFVSYRDPIVLGGCPSSSTFNATQTGRVDWSF